MTGVSEGFGGVDGGIALATTPLVLGCGFDGMVWDVAPFIGGRLVPFRRGRLGGVDVAM